jgi:REP element-mobilizing transposase RayT
MRKPRKLKQGASYHVIARANRSEMIFNSPKIKEMFMEVVRRAKGKYRFEVRNFCIMGNHIHLILKPLQDQNLSAIMQWILSVFAMKFNRLFGYIGHVFYDRFKSKIIKSFHQYLTTFVYIAKNPVRANITECATDFAYNGITFLYKGQLDILERPPNPLLRRVWYLLHHSC